MLGSIKLKPTLEIVEILFATIKKKSVQTKRIFEMLRKSCGFQNINKLKQTFGTV